MLTLTEYLTEKSLGEILKAWAREENVVSQPMVPGTRMRYDYEVTKNGQHIFVEFDGDSHFRDANVIFRDDAKDGIARSLGKKVVRIPYFIQLDKITFKHFFGEEFDISTTFPHGFITSKMLPASFCRIGAIRANRIMSELPAEVYDAVFESLAEKAKNLPEYFVYHTVGYAEDEEGKSLNFEQWVEACNKVHSNKYDYSRSRLL